jgi:cytoskeletal protein RodZ
LPELKDQAKPLRQQMKTHHTDQTGEDMKRQSIPPRSRVHKRSRQKKKRWKLTFPLIRLLLVLFLALIVAAITSPYWLP